MGEQDQLHIQESSLGHSGLWFPTCLPLSGPEGDSPGGTGKKLWEGLLGNLEEKPPRSHDLHVGVTFCKQ